MFMSKHFECLAERFWVEMHKWTEKYFKPSAGPGHLIPHVKSIYMMSWYVQTVQNMVQSP